MNSFTLQTQSEETVSANAGPDDAVTIGHCDRVIGERAQPLTR